MILRHNVVYTLCVCVYVCVFTLTGDDNTELGDQSFQYITTDNMKSTRDDSLPRTTVSAYSQTFFTYHYQ